MPDGISKSEMAASYGFALSFMNSSPELKTLFGQAVKQTWTADKFIARLRGTKWFKKHSSSVRNAILQKTADPATYKANVDQMFATVRDSYGKTFGEAGMSDKQMRNWAETAHRMGWSEAELMDHMVGSVNFRKVLANDALGGTAAQVQDQVKALGVNFGVDLGDNWVAAQVGKVVEGNDTMEGLTSRVRDLAKRQYKAFADDIDGGATIAEIADPYRQKMADLLELNPHDVSLQDGMLQKALKSTDAKGNPAAMDFSDFTDMVRQDKRWQYTDNAHKQVAGVTEGLLRQFGLLA